MGAVIFLIESCHLNLREACNVDLAPSLNFLAICAAILFIGVVMMEWAERKKKEQEATEQNESGGTPSEITSE